MILILAAGNQTRWNHGATQIVLPKIKQLVKIGEETLIQNIQRKFPGAIVVTKNEDIKKHSLKWFEPEYNDVTIATLYSTRDLWEEWTTILLGDVLYGKNTRRLLKNQEENLMFYGDGGEIYAIKFSLRASMNIVTGIHNIITSKNFRFKYGKLWNLYRAINRVDFRYPFQGKFFTFVDDCRDFDRKRQYLKYAKNQQIRK